MRVLYEGIGWLIETAYSLCGDYGIAIVIITVIVRLCLLPLNRKQQQTIKQQQKINLQAQEIKDKYKSNTVKMNKELERLYSGEGTGSLGCLLSIIQVPIMIGLYNGIRLTVTADVSTIILPWVPSLLVRDSTYILPVITVFVQVFPQMIPYLNFFKKLELQKMSIPMILVMLVTNGWFATMLPAGIELYYMVSGVFTTIEKVSQYMSEMKEKKLAVS